MYESEMVDILVGISEGNYIVEQKQVQKGSKQAEEAKQVMAVLAYRGMKEGSAIYRKVGKSFMQLHPEVDYPMILELEKKLNGSYIGDGAVIGDTYSYAIASKRKVKTLVRTHIHTR